jgi:superfamily II DNA/RNA helicase
MYFNQLGLHPALLAAVEASGYTEPTAVQAQAIPAALAGADLLVSSFTGSGKTAAFILPSLQRLSAEPAVKGNGPRILVLTPTRELAMQVERAAMTYGSKLDKRLRAACLVGGMPYPLQMRKLQGPVDVVVATPGRLIDHLERGRVDFKRLEVLVLDEADRMLDMGFIEDIEKIIGKTPSTRQTLLFSATLDGVVGNMARRITREPRRIQIAPTPERKAHIEQSALFADSLNHKTSLLDALLRDVDVRQALIFTSTKRAADDLSGALREQGFSAQALHGDMNQTQRNRTLKGLVDGHTRVLVATDVAARGIDVAGISHVINFDAPRQAEDYVHRIGRTGRAGRTGIAVTLVNHSERHLLRDIERFTGQQVKVDTIAGLEPSKRAEPRKPAGRFQKKADGFGKAKRGARGGPQARPWLAR